jgi:c-di-GMP-binding flagellar brake protein YcgR
MKYVHADRRAEVRWPVEARAIIHKNNGESIPAVGANISAAGMLLRVEQASKFSVDEAVTVEVELKEEPDRPFCEWGLARIAFIDGDRLGIELSAGIFDAGTGDCP